MLLCAGCLTLVQVAYHRGEAEEVALQKLGLASQKLWASESRKITLDKNPAKMLLASTSRKPHMKTLKHPSGLESDPLEHNPLPGNRGGDEGEKTHFLRMSNAPPIVAV